MNVDSECHDAKVSHSEMLRSGMITQTNGELCMEVIASDGNDLLSTLADELATTMEDDLSGVFDDNDSDEHAHWLTTLSENEQEVHQFAMKIVNETVMGSDALPKGCAVTVETISWDNIQLQRKSMNHKKLHT